MHVAHYNGDRHAGNAILEANAPASAPFRFEVPE
jgi:hypothetical protein